MTFLYDEHLQIYEALLYVHGRNAPQQQRERYYMWQDIQAMLERSVRNPGLSALAWHLQRTV